MLMQTSTALGDIGKLTPTQKAAIEAAREQMLRARLVGTATRTDQKRAVKTLKRQFKAENKAAKRSRTIKVGTRAIPPGIVQAATVTPEAVAAALLARYGQGAAAAAGSGVTESAEEFNPPMSTGGGGSAPGGDVEVMTGPLDALVTAGAQPTATTAAAAKPNNIAVPALIAAALYLLG